jgi:hypothetical protein
MEDGEHDWADVVRTELDAIYVKHRCCPEFSSTYQRVLERLVPPAQGTARTRVTNELALIIEQLGIVRRAQLVPPRSARERAR